MTTHLDAAPEGARELPLSWGQKGLWIEERLAPESGAYNLAVAMRLWTTDGRPVEAEALRRAFLALAQRHPALRTTFSLLPEGEPVQRVHERLDPDFILCEEAGAWSESEFQGRLVEEARHPFELQHGPLLRVRLFRRGSADLVTLVVVHHLVADFGSMKILAAELSALASPAGAGLVSRPRTGYDEYIRQEQERLASPAGEQLWEHWSARLADAPDLDLPTDRPRPAFLNHRGGAVSRRLGAPLVEGLRALAGGAAATPFMVLFASFQALLVRLTGQHDLVVGVPSADRTGRFRNVVGYFVNPLAIRVDLAGDPSMPELLARVRAHILEDFRHHGFPFPLLAERLLRTRTSGRPQLFQVMLNFLGMPPAGEEVLPALVLGEAGGGVRARGLVIEPVRLPRWASQVDLALTVAGIDGDLVGSLEHDSDLFDRTTVLRWAGQWEELLRGWLSDGERRLWDLPLLGEAERAQLVVEWNETGWPEPGGEECLHELLEAQAARTPEALALVAGGEGLSYGELDRRANRLARCLRELGIGPEKVVGVFLDRSAEMVVTLLGVLKSGGVYLPMDPAYPRERLALLLADAAAELVVSREALLGGLPETASRVLCWEDLPAAEPERPSEPQAVAGNLAYLIYTSGSTGRPKGVAIEHRSAVTFLRWAREAFSDAELSGVLAATSMSFDLAVFELFAPLSTGGTVILVENSLALRGLAALPEVTLINLVPSAASELLHGGSLPPSVRTVNLAGEALSAELVRRLTSLGTVGRVINLYGPSETTTYSTFAEVTGAEEGTPPIGRPVRGTRAYVLDRELRPVPVGVAGELWLAGAGMARGYYGRPDLTAERFVPDPFGRGERLYRTGDLVRSRTDGELQYLGRRDHQVKVRGFRIELGEVEAALLRHPAVRETAVVARGTELVGYVVPAQEIVSPLVLLAFLKQRLPGFMIPSSWVLLAELPRTPNGKLDRAALPAPDRTGGGSASAPRTALEAAVAEIWASVLGQERVSLDDDFFTVGGHSLAAMRLLSRISERFGVDLPLRRLFEKPTLAELAAAIEASLAPARLPPLCRWPREGPPAVSFAQERLWLLEQLDPGGATYNMGASVSLWGRVDPARLAACLGEIVRRHESLRTVFEAFGGEPRQRIELYRGLVLPEIDLLGLPADELRQEVERLEREAARRPFDLTRGPLLRMVLLLQGPERSELVVVMHHIISDGWSMGVLSGELQSLYEASLSGRPSPLPELPIQYADYALWQREWLQGEELERQLGYWRERLSGLPVLELPSDRPRPAVRTYRGGRLDVVLEGSLVERLESLARSRVSTTFMVLLAGFSALLGRYGGSPDLAVGTPIANRERPELEGLIGFFVNTLVLRSDLSGDPGFGALLGRVREVMLGAYAHQDLPFEKLVAELRPGRTGGLNPLFQVMLALQNTPRPPLALSGLQVETAEIDTGTSKFDLTIWLAPTSSGLQGAAEYSSDLFDRTTVARMLAHLEAVLRSASSSPDRRISELDLLSAGERHQVISEWNATGSSYLRERCLHELFEQQARRRPEAEAVIFGSERLSYGELDRRASRLAQALQAAGVGPEMAVGLCLERSAAAVVSILGVLKAGGAYVPLDPGYPPERLAWMAGDAGVAVLLTDGSAAGAFLAQAMSGIVRLEVSAALAEGLGGEDREPRPSPSWPETLAYVMYTSGSTGRPKGVEVTHGNVVRLILGAEYVCLGPGETLLQLAPLSFDASTFEIWGALLTGGRLVVAPPGPLSVLELGHVVSASGVTTLWLTAGLFREVVEGGLEPLRGVRQLLAGGDVLPPMHVAHALSELPETVLINGYGPTEGTTFTSCHRLRAGDRWTGSVPLGRPISNTQTYVLDERMEPLPPGIHGELYAGGGGVSRGYRNRPDLTAERFVPDPWGEPGSRLYRTGDMARWLSEGVIEFAGRRDQQVKIRGFRVEPGEVEAALAAHPELQDAAVLVRRPDGEARLVAYVVPVRPGGALEPDLRAWLGERVPFYLVPSDWVFLPSLPLTANGKLDRAALPEPSRLRSAEPRELRTETEHILAAIWSQVLGLESVGAEEDFFALGGHSLKATQVVSRVRERFGVGLPLRRLFETPTLAELASAIEASVSPARVPPLRRWPREDPPAVSFAQERLWLLEQLDPGGATYNVGASVALCGRVEPARLAACLGEIVRRHESLRTVFEDSGGEPRQRIEPYRGLVLPVVDLSGLPAGELRRESERLEREPARHPFDLSRGPLLRVLLLLQGPERSELVVVMHHIISDGWSMGVLSWELQSLYEASLSGRPSPLPELPIQYADYALWQREWLQGEELERQLGYWRERLSGLPVLELPPDRPRPAVRTYWGGRLDVVLDGSLVQRLESLGRHWESTTFMVLLAGFSALLGRYAGSSDLAVGTPIANRERLELEGLIGFFVNTLVLRSDLSGDPEFGELLGRVREVMLGAYAHQDLPFEKLVAELRPGRTGGHNPLFQMMLALQNAPLPPLALPGLQVETAEIDTGVVRFDLALSLTRAQAGLSATLRYAADLFDRATVERMLSHFRTLLEGIAADPECRISELRLLSPSERHQALVEWQGAQTPELGPSRVHDDFEEQARRRPEAVAVVFEGESLAYGELNRRANRLAWRLRRLGVGAESRVGICLERSLEMVVALLAVLKAGGAYVPLDPTHPSERLSWLWEDSGAVVLLARRGAVELGVPPLRVVDPAEEGLVEEGEENPSPPAERDSLAYVLYTSGTTGRPKGVMVPHRGVVNHLRWRQTEYGLGESDCLVHKAPLGFDASVWELLWPLSVGARLIVARPGGHQDVTYLVDLVQRERVTFLHAVPSLLRVLVEEPGLKECTSLRWVTTGGEPLPKEVRERFFTVSAAELLHGYGPTEASIGVTYAPCERRSGRPTMLGRPIANAEIYLTDRELSPVPLGVAGELCIGGVCLARGYLGRPELTAERFIPHPWSGVAGARLYRSGDLVRRRADGGLEFLGRIDHQVKVRGIRIEPAEIESVLSAHPGVREAVVLACEAQDGDKRLVAYVVDGEGVETEALRSYLSGKLPPHMVPSGFVVLESLPLMANGKVDRLALARIEPGLAGLPARAFVAPRNAIEEKLAEIWRGVLGVEQVGVEDDFFELGGHSLLAVQVISRVREAFGSVLPVRILFESPTVARLADAIDSLRWAGQPRLPAAADADYEEFEI